jgi:hypothetical protein
MTPAQRLASVLQIRAINLALTQTGTTITYGDLGRIIGIEPYQGSITTLLHDTAARMNDDGEVFNPTRFVGTRTKKPGAGAAKPFRRRVSK